MLNIRMNVKANSIFSPSDYDNKEIISQVNKQIYDNIPELISIIVLGNKEIV